MSLNKQETTVNVGGSRFAPSVNYGAAVRSPNRTVADFPKVQTANFNIDLSGLEKYASQRNMVQAQAEYDAGLGEYAVSIDEIVEGQRQGVYNASTAERMIRSLSGDYIRRGYNVKDLSTVRNAHDGGIYANEEARQKIITEHEQDRQLKRIDEVRNANPGMKHLSDAAVERKLAYVDGLYDTITNYNQALQTLDQRSPEYQQLVQERNYAYQNFAEVNLLMNLNNMVQSELMSGRRLTSDDITQLKRVFINNAMAMGMSASDASFNWEQAYNRTDIATLYSETNKDVTENTAFMKRAADFIDTNAQLGMRSTLAGVAVMNMPSEIRAQLGQYSRGFYDMFVDQTFKKNYTKDPRGRMYLDSVDILGVNLPADYKENIKFSHTLLNSNISDVSYPPRLIARQAAGVSGMDVQGILVNGNMSDEDLQKAITNADNMSRTYDTPAFKAIMGKARASNNPDAIAAVNEYEFNQQVINGKKAGAKLSLSFTDSKRSLNSIMNSLQADRLRIDPDTGYFVMLEDTEGFLQSTGDLFASEGTRQTLNKLNSYLDNMEPVERRTAAMVMTSGNVPSLRSGEAVWDTSKQSLYEKGIDAASTAATKALQGIEGMQKEDTVELLKSYVDRIEKQSAGLSDAAKKEYGEGTKRVLAQAKAKIAELEEEEEEELIPAEDTPVTDFYDPNTEIAIPFKEDVKVPTLPGAVAIRKAELQYLQGIKQAMDDYPQEYNSKQYQQITTRIAQIEKVLEEYNR